MTYEEALSYIHKTLKFGSRPGLETTKELLCRLSNPQNDLKFIHVAGTNGKGSTVSFLSRILKNAGYRTGSYISPYIEDFCERISLNGENIGRNDVASLTEVISHVISEMVADGFSHPTEFEIITAMAFLWFKKQKVDIVVLETGLGGRLDATNVIFFPLVSVITSISYDHVNILGDTLDAIAYEKCGIIKSPSPVVLYPIQAEEVFHRVKNTAKDRGCFLSIPDVCAIEILSESILGSEFRYKGKEYFVSLPGEHQIYNAVTAIETLSLLKDFPVSYENVKAGLKLTFFPARVELISNRPDFLIDGAHNADGVRTLVKVIDEQLPSYSEITIICGMLRDKDYSYCIPKIAKRATHFIATCPDNPRKLLSAETAKVAEPYCQDIYAFDSPENALKEALLLTPSDGIIIICGSLYLAGVLRPLVKNFSTNKANIPQKNKK